MTRRATSQDGADRPPFVSIAEAARILNVSPTTVKRRIRAGTLEAEQLARPQGFEYRVRVRVDGARDDARDDAPPATAMSVSESGTAHATTHDTTHARCFDELAASRQTIERQAEQLVRQAETLGRLTAELDAERRAHSPEERNPGPESPDPSPEPPRPFPWPLPPSPNVRAGALWVLTTLAIVTLAALLAWPG